MILEIVKYGHPALRQKGAPITEITPEIKKFIQDMLDTMYEHHGVGLAAQQVAKALQVTVIDVRAATDRPSSMEIDGQPVDVDKYMPIVLINPVIMPVGKPVAGPEGCLSFPEIYTDITRPETVDVTAINAEGQTLQFRCGGLLARAAQHETDHLHGILFIDRMSKAVKESFRPELDDLQAETKEKLAAKR